MAEQASMLPPIPTGLTHRQCLTVTDALTVPAVSGTFTGFVDMPPVFATAFMVGFIEWTCIDALRPYLSDSQRTVGTHVDVSHVAATPVGITVMAEVELVESKGRTLRFRVACRDEAGPIGEGFHERAIVDHEKFLARVNAKRGEASRV